MALARYTKGYAQEKRKRPRHPIMVKRTNEVYGGLDGDGGLGRKNGRVRSGGTKTARATTRTQGLTTFHPTNHTLFMAHAGGCVVWWGWMS